MTGWLVVFWGSAAILVYIFAGYPLLIRGLAALLPKPVQPAPNDTPFSILIAAHNEAHVLPEKIRSLLQSEGMEGLAELVVASDGSDDGTADVCRQVGDERIRVIEYPGRRGKPSVLNDAVEHCSGDILLLMDARQRVAPDAVQQILSCFSDPAVGVVSGELVFEEADEGYRAAGHGVNAYWRYEKCIREAESRFHSVPGATGALYGIRRSLFRPIPADTLLDDVAIPMEAVCAGFRCIFCSRARVYDRPSASSAQEALRKRRTAAGNAQLVREFPRWLLPRVNPIWWQYLSHKVLRLVSPLLLLSLLVSNVFLAGSLGFAALLLAQALFYGLALAGKLYGQAGVLGVPLMFVSMNVSAVQGVISAFRRDTSAAWSRAYNP